MAIAFPTTIAPVRAEPPTGLKEVGGNITKAFGDVENYMLADAKQALNPNNAFMRPIPLPVEQMFNRYEAQIRTPEERKIFETMKKNTYALYARKNENTQQQVSRNIESEQIQLSVKAASKIIAAIQQLLSSQ
ncbi:hypothetical protein FJU08_16025 [Martelella alba]|uniref:Uncharacterized protein n=1 Tax=Martelella alba TaxID=2590451 RepID=A0A506U7A6_9HYPH|nr:hypothetical protein [Martelella alba]TPW28835.1 hypothetical protein FJU08_16025 [Martelella alba]